MRIVIAFCFLFLAASEAAKPREDDYFEPFSFGFITDNPVDDEQVAKFDVLIEDVNKNRDLRWIIHSGDIKGEADRCDDELLEARFEQFQKFDFPFIYTPGDNEWTDCHRVSAGKRRPLERLQFLRRTFFPMLGFSTGGSWKKLQTQASNGEFKRYVENMMWYESGVVFSTVHVVGSNNDLRPWIGLGEPIPEGPIPTTVEDCSENNTWCAVRLAEFVERKAAALEWIKATFETAEKEDAKGVYITMHANPHNFVISDRVGASEGFEEIIVLLGELSIQFDKPVILAHGETNFFRIDHPIVGRNGAGQLRRVVKFTRLEGFGGSDVYWVKVVVDANTPNVFQIVPMLIEENYPF